MKALTRQVGHTTRRLHRFVAPAAAALLAGCSATTPEGRAFSAYWHATAAEHVGYVLADDSLTDAERRRRLDAVRHAGLVVQLIDDATYNGARR